jgi:hypothetical protein
MGLYALERFYEQRTADQRQNHKQKQANWLQNSVREKDRRMSE